MPKYMQDFLSGVTFIVISLAFGLQYDKLSGVSRIFPEALISIIAAGGIYYIIKSFFLYRKEKQAQKENGDPDEKFLFGRVAYITAAAFILIFLIEYLGFYTASFIFLFISYLYLANRKNGMAKNALHAFIFSICFIFAVWGLFHFILLVPTPAGLFI